jgi:hypothetical protein
MKRSFAFVAVLLVSAAFVSAKPAVRVTVRQLLAAPQKFDGAQVEVVGYHKTSNDETSLFSNEREAQDHWSPENGIWLDPVIWDPRYYPQRPPEVARPEDVDRRIVRVVGTFHYQPRPVLGKNVPYERRYRGYGSYRMWACALTDITYCQPLR